MTLFSSRLTRYALRLLPLLPLLAACAVGPDFVRPELPKGAGYLSRPLPAETAIAAGASQTFRPEGKVVAQWWRKFGTAKLDAVVDEALAGNQDLQAARARLRQSQELLRAGSGIFFPQIDGSAGFTRQKFSAARFGGGFRSSIFNLYSASLGATYDLPLFGRSRRQVEGLQAQADYQRYEEKAAWLTLIGNVVNTAIAWSGYRAQIEALEQIIAFERRQLKIVEAKRRAGMVAETDVLSLRSQLAASEARVPPLRQSRDRARHLLASLVGRSPGVWAAPELALDNFVLPSDLPLTLPSTLVRRRPDILAAEAQLHSASADIGVATANLFPSISLSATYGQESTRFSDLFKGMSSFWNWGGSLTQPLFHGGSLWHRRKAAIAAYDAALADYRQTVLTAFAQVADALRALEHDAETLKAQAAALDHAERNLSLLQNQYQAGIVSYLQVLDADRQYQQARIGVVQAKTLRLQDTAVFFQALGGGWWQPPDGEPNMEAAVSKP